eukprot:3813455-Prymnesium_polylepis.1
MKIEVFPQKPRVWEEPTSNVTRGTRQTAANWGPRQVSSHASAARCHPHARTLVNPPNTARCQRKATGRNPRKDARRDSTAAVLATAPAP